MTNKAITGLLRCGDGWQSVDGRWLFERRPVDRMMREPRRFGMFTWWVHDRNGGFPDGRPFATLTDARAAARTWQERETSREHG
jgi:hypothetical protein